MIRKRLIVIAVVMAFLYVMAFFTLFGQISVLSSMLYFLWFFVLFHFFCMETYQYKFRYFVAGISILAIVMAIVFGGMNFWTIVAILVLHAGIVFLFDTLQDSLSNKIRFSSMNYFVSGGYIFTVFVTIGYGIALIGTYTTFPFTCEGLSASSNAVVDTVTRPFKLWLEEIVKFKDQAKLFFWAQVKDVVQLDKQLSYSPDAGPLGWISKQLVHQVQAENISTSMWICDYLLGKVNMEFGKPEFAASLILLLFLLLYPFVRIVFRVMSLIGYIIFKLCYLTGAYKTSVSKVEIEKIV